MNAIQADELADKARESISDYCVNECEAYCCKKGYLVLNSEEVDLLVGDKINILLKDEVLIEMEAKQFSLSLGKGGCPRLDGSKCTIHKNPKRPSTCKHFPIFIEGKKIRFSDRCYAIKEGKLYSFIRDFVKAGYEIN